MARSLDLLSYDNVVFTNFAFYATLVLLKMFAMSALTIVQRLKKNVSILVLMTTNTKSKCNIIHIEIMLIFVKYKKNVE